MKRIRRLVYETTAERVEEIEEMIEKAGFRDRKELFNWGMSFVEWAIDQAEKGRKIYSAPADGQPGEAETVFFPFMDTAAKSKKARDESKKAHAESKKTSAKPKRGIRQLRLMVDCIILRDWRIKS